MDQGVGCLRSEEPADMANTVQLEKVALVMDAMWGLREIVASKITPRLLAEADVRILSSPIRMAEIGFHRPIYKCILFF